MSIEPNGMSDPKPENMQEQTPLRPKRSLRLTLTSRLRAYFFAGVLITAPISLTIYLAWLLIDFIDKQVMPLIPVHYNPETYLPFSVPGIGLVLLLTVITLIGALTAGFLGRLLVRAGEAVVNRLPVVRSVYGAVKQIMEAVLAQQSNAFRQVVLVEYPRKDCWVIGFVSGATTGEVQARTEAEVINVFIPTTPNPTSGFLLFVPREDMVYLDMSIEQGIKMVVSGGIVAPPWPAGQQTEVKSRKRKELPQPVSDEAAAAQPERR